MRLLSHIFLAATDVPEFQRQLATPNVPKFSLALIALAEKQDDREVEVAIPWSVHSHCALFDTGPTDLVCICSHKAHTVISNFAPSPTRCLTIAITEIS
jgi:hypothetical protein